MRESSFSYVRLCSLRNPSPFIGFNFLRQQGLSKILARWVEDLDVGFRIGIRFEDAGSRRPLSGEDALHLGSIGR